MLARMTDPKVATGVKFSENEKLSFCDACASGKTHRSTTKAIGEIRTTRCLQLVHSDVCGPVNVPSVNKSRYIMLRFKVNPQQNTRSVLGSSAGNKVGRRLTVSRKVYSGTASS